MQAKNFWFEYLEGGHLFDRIVKQQKLSEREASLMMKQVIDFFNFMEMLLLNSSNIGLFIVVLSVFALLYYAFPCITHSHTHASRDGARDRYRIPVRTLWGSDYILLAKIEKNEFPISKYPVIYVIGTGRNQFPYRSC